MEPDEALAVSVRYSAAGEIAMVAQIQRLENAARVAMGDFQTQDPAARRERHPAYRTARIAVVALAVIAAGFLAFGLI